ncbi:unnamed protein product [Protopolystoma xenopodis]|uniref:Vps16 C-terminal domain-containing protein n=1 Tax=Protopolystoma xenopodis TaxID=117903 RepID=A0A3S5CH14_9PLAT|nr:unnamed protein product [Protopolystoma xenopodis]
MLVTASDSLSSPGANPLSLERTHLLAHWACRQPAKEPVPPSRLAEVVARLCSSSANASASASASAGPPDMYSSKGLSTGNNGRPAGSAVWPAGLSFADVAGQAILAGRLQLAEQLVDYEPRAWRQVQLLLRLERFPRSLARAVDSGDPELIALVIFTLKEQVGGRRTSFTYFTC